MLTKQMVRKFNKAECQEARDNIISWQALTDTRIERLKATQVKNPNWAAYDKYADDIVGIDIRIEEQSAVRDMLDEELQIIREQECTIMLEAKGIPHADKISKSKRKRRGNG